MAMTIDDCIGHGLEFNPQILAHKVAVNEAEFGINEAWGAFLPTLGIDFNYSHLENDGRPAMDRDYIDQKNRTLNISLSQPIYTGSAGVAGLKKSRKVLEYRQHELTLLQQNLALQIHTSFYSVLRWEQLLQKWTASLDRLEKQRTIVKAWIAQDLAPRQQLLVLESVISDMHKNIAQAKSGHRGALANLKELLAWNHDEELTVTGDFQGFPSLSCNQLDMCIDDGTQQRIELKLSGLNIAMAREDARIILARNKPNVSLNAVRTESFREYSTHSLDDVDREYYTFSLNVTFRPFQGGKNIYAYRRQLLTVRRLTHDQTSRLNMVRKEVIVAFARISEVKTALNSAISKLNEAREEFRLTKRSVSLNIGSLDELLNSELSLTAAEISKINAQYDLYLAFIQLNNTTGNNNPPKQQYNRK